MQPPSPPPDRVIKEGEQPKKLEPVKPKKPRKWDGWLSVAFISICILMVLIFGRTEFDLNAKVAAVFIPIGLCHYSYYLLIGRRRRSKKYVKDIREYDNKVRMASNTRYKAKRQKDFDKEVSKIVEENLRRGTKAWDTRNEKFGDLLPRPGRARVGRRIRR